MKYCVLLFLLCFLPIIFCLDVANYTEDDECPVLRVRRKKRYTRWNEGQDGSPEFIVKVIDDDTAPNVPAISVPHITKEEKIIVGGAIVPSPTSPTLTDSLEYTRFMPPTVTKDIVVEVFSVAATPDPIYVRAIHPKVKGVIKKKPIKHKVANRERDESPPVSPQFVTRTSLIAAQYAAIAPVSFSQHGTLSPLTPPHGPFPLRTTLKHATRTTYPSINKPTNTWSPLKAFRMSIPTHSTYQDIPPPTRTSLPKIVENHDKIYGDSGRTNKNIERSYNVLYDEENEHSLDDKDTEKSESKENYDIERASVGADAASYNDTETEHDDDEEKTAETGSSLRRKPYNTKKMSDAVKISPILRKNNNCDLTKFHHFNYKSARTLPEIVDALKMWAEKKPIAKLIDITERNFTAMENPIYMMVIDDPSNGQTFSAKKTVMIVAGIQGRDHHSVTSAMFVLHQLLDQTDKHSELLLKFRFWIIPVFNPDGYEYSMTFPHRREWVRNLRQSWEECNGRDFCKNCETYGLRCTVQNCYGVNLDKNFEYQWIPIGKLQSQHPCDPAYAGQRHLSESETIAITSYLHSIRVPIATFIAFKEGDVLGILYPYSHTKRKRKFDDVYRHKASQAANAASEIKGRRYSAGQTSEFLPLNAGGIEDWVEGHLGIDNTYVIMLFRPQNGYGSNIMETVTREAFAAMDSLLLHEPSVPLGLNRNLFQTRGGPDAANHQQPSLTLTTYLVIMMMMT